MWLASTARSNLEATSSIHSVRLDLYSCALFLRKSEAANLMISDLSVPRDAVTGKLLLESGLPKVVIVHIRRSITDQTGQGYIVELHGWYIHCFSGHLCKFRTAAFVAKKLQGPKVVSSDCSYDMASCSQVHHWIIYLHELFSMALKVCLKL